MVAKHIKRLWQQRWDRSTTGRVIYELMCDVGKSMLFASDIDAVPSVMVGYCLMIPHWRYISSEQAQLSQNCAIVVMASMTYNTFFSNAIITRPSGVIWSTNWVQQVLSSISWLSEKTQVVYVILLVLICYEQISNRLSTEIHSTLHFRVYQKFQTTSVEVIYTM